MRRLALFVAAATAIACGGSSTAPTTVTAPVGTVTTETFMGTLNPPPDAVTAFDAKVHAFTVTTAGGDINITLLSAGPPATIQLGLALGNPSTTGACAILPIQGFNVHTAAGTTAQIPGTSAPAGAYCVAVYDFGNVLQPVSYTVTVAHT